MKNILLASALSLLSFNAFAQAEVVRIELNDGTVYKYNVADVKVIDFEDAPLTDGFAGEFAGTNTVNVGGMVSYTASVTMTITANEDETLNITIPTYVLSNTVMGDLTLGEHTISNIAWDEEAGVFKRAYGSDGIKMHFTAVQGGTTSMDSDYELNGDSYITIEKTDNGIKVVDSFSLGNMPFGLTATFEGTK